MIFESHEFGPMSADPSQWIEVCSQVADHLRMSVFQRGSRFLVVAEAGRTFGEVVEGRANLVRQIRMLGNRMSCGRGHDVAEALISKLPPISAEAPSARDILRHLGESVKQ